MRNKALTPRKIKNWMRRYNPRFGSSPLEIIAIQGSTGAKRVAYEIEQLELGTAELVKSVLAIRKT
jgi:hypothetical protein